MTSSLRKTIKFMLTLGAIVASGVGLGAGYYEIDDDGNLTIYGSVKFDEVTTVSNVVLKWYDKDGTKQNPGITSDSALLIVKSGSTISIDSEGKGAIGCFLRGPIQFGEGEEATSPITIAPCGGSTLRPCGTISGHENIEINCSGRVEMANIAGDYDGTITSIKGDLAIEDKKPFGNGNFSVDFDNGNSRKIHFKGGTIYGDVHVLGAGGDNMQFSSGFTTTINGDVYVNSSVSWDFQSGSKVYFNGRLLSDGATQLVKGNANSRTVQPEIHWNGGGTNLSIWYFAGGKNYVTNTIFCSSLNARGEVVYSAPFYPSANKRTEYILQCEKPFMHNDGTSYLNPRTEDARDVMYTADGVDPIFAQFGNGKDAIGANASGNWWTPVNGFMHFGSTTTNKFRFVTTKATQYWFGMGVGNASMAFEAKNSKIYVGGTNSTSTGTLSAENSGTVIELVKDYPVSNNFIYATARWAGDLMVTNGGKIVINDNANFSNGKTITIADANSSIYVTNGVGIVAKLVLDGVEQTGFGTWGGNDCAITPDHVDARILGEGVITNVSAYTIETSKAIPAEGITVSELIFSGNCNLTGGPVTIVNGGSIVSHGAVTIRCPLVMGCSDRKSAPISIRKITPSGASANSSMVIYGTISGNEDIEIWDNGDVWFCGNNTFDGNLTVMQGVFYVNNDHALGSTNGWTRCDCAQPLKPVMVFKGVTTAEPFFLRDPWSKRIVVNGTNVFNGLVTLIGTTVENCWAVNYNWNEWDFKANSKTYFNGGLTRDGTASFEGCGDPTAEIYWNSDFDIGRVMYMKGGTNIVNCHFTQSGGQAPGWRVRGSTWVMNVEDAIAGANLAMENGERVTYILNANQTFTQFFEAKAAYAKNDKIDFNSTGDYVAKFTEANVKGLTGGNKWFGKATGSASLALLGANSEILIGGQSTSSGTLTLSNGYTVVMAPTNAYTEVAKWSGNIEIFDNSTLIVNDVNNFNKKKTSLKFHGENSKISIPEGVSIMVDSLWVDDTQYTASSYTELGNHITGGGTLEVRQHGLIMLFR